MNNLLKAIALAFLIPCAVLAQVFPAEQEELAEETIQDESSHSIDYFSPNAWVLLGFGWRYTLDGDTVSTTKDINIFLDQNEYSSGYLTKSKITGYSAATLAIGGLAFLLSVALTAPLWIDTDRESTPEWVTKTGNAIIASIPLDWLLLYESNRYYQMSIDSYTLGGDVMVGNEKNRKSVKNSKIMNYVGIAMTLGTVLLLDVGLNKKSNDDSSANLYFAGAAFLIPLDWFVLALSHLLYSDARVK
jgi:hypothetical protein